MYMPKREKKTINTVNSPTVVIRNKRRLTSPDRRQLSPRRDMTLKLTGGSPVRKVNKVPICDQIAVAIPRCLCGATVANCVVDHCHQVLGENPNALITLEDWKRACVSQSPYCTSLRQQEEACSIVWDEEKIAKHNANANAKHNANAKTRTRSNKHNTNTNTRVRDGVKAETRPSVGSGTDSYWGWWPW